MEITERFIVKLILIVSVLSFFVTLWILTYYRTDKLGVHSWEVCANKYGLDKDLAGACKTPEGKIFVDNGRFSL